MDEVTVYDQSGKLLAVLDNADAVSYELKHNDLWTGSFSLPTGDPKNVYCQAHNLVRLPQTIELTPALVLEHGKTFKHGYRNVIVVKKMTFPNDKLLTIEMTEQQISGRNISLNIDYEDVLSADSFNTALLEEE